MVLRVNVHCFKCMEYFFKKSLLFAVLFKGYLPLQYVIEVRIMPWDPKDSRNTNAVGLMKAQPIHEDECGNVYIRRGSCTTLASIDGAHGVGDRNLLFDTAELLLCCVQ